jgi:drug/metabolite transporter (DMT)-like permease
VILKSNILTTTSITKNPSSRFWIGVLILVIANIGFSSKAVLIKLMYQYHIDTISVISLRMVFSLPFFIIIALYLAQKTDNVRLSFKDWLTISGLGILSYYVSSMLDFLGLQYVSAGVERLILFTYPTMVVVLSAIFLKKKITIPQYFALLLTYIGVAIIFVAEAGLGLQKDFWRGAVYIFTCAFTYSLYVIGTGQMVQRIGSVKFSCYAMIAATVPCLIQSYVYNGVDIFHYPKEIYYLTVWLSIIATVIPIFLIVEGIRLVGASNSSIIGFSGPISVIILAYFLLGEQITVVQLLGTGVVLLGIFMVTWRK